MSRESSLRTGSTKWKQLRAQVKRKAQRDGIDHCPECGILLDYQRHGQRNSVDIDHIIPYSRGGRDHMDNLRPLCARCNRSLGAKQGNKMRARKNTSPNNNNSLQAAKPKTGRTW